MSEDLRNGFTKLLRLVHVSKKNRVKLVVCVNYSIKLMPERICKSYRYKKVGITERESEVGKLSRHENLIRAFPLILRIERKKKNSFNLSEVIQ